jgi:hypothetical protein
MSWKSTLRAIERAGREAERSSKRRQRELERQQKEQEKMLELDRAQYEVEVFENRLAVLTSIHKECRPAFDWEAILNTTPPQKLDETNRHERNAKHALETYQPSRSDKLLKRVEKKRQKLSEAVVEAKREDRAEFEKAVMQYNQDFLKWEKLHQIASGINAGKPDAYNDAIKELEIFDEMGELGSKMSIEIEDPRLADVRISVHGESTIPSEVKSVLKSGKLSVKKMPKTRYYEIYQDHVCGCVLRIANELFALLPFEAVIITAESELVNTKSGHLEMFPILSVAIPRNTLERLNIQLLDPSDAMGNFVHKMNFKKTKGFVPIECISPAELNLT